MGAIEAASVLYAGRVEGLRFLFWPWTLRPYKKRDTPI